MRTIYSLLLVALITAGCASSPRSQEAPEVYVSTLRVLPPGDGPREIGITFLLRNPNEYPVELDSIEYNVRIGSEGFLEGVVENPGIVPALGDLRVRTTASSEFISSVSRLTSFLQGPESALPYTATGTIWLDTRPRRNLRFEQEGRAPLAISATP